MRRILGEPIIGFLILPTIGVVAMLVCFIGYSFKLHLALQSTSRSLHDIKLAIEQYRADNMSLPPTGNEQLWAALRGQYLDFDPRFVSKNGKLLDSFGSPYVYNMPARYSGQEYDLYSLGPNGKDEDGLGDDVIAW